MKTNYRKEQVQEYTRFLLENSFFLIIGTAAGLTWANLNWPSYERIIHQIHFAVNDIGMVFFLASPPKRSLRLSCPAAHWPHRARQPCHSWPLPGG
jgi:hypothetical protein